MSGFAGFGGAQQPPSSTTSSFASSSGFGFGGGSAAGFSQPQHQQQHQSTSSSFSGFGQQQQPPSGQFFGFGQTTTTTMQSNPQQQQQQQQFFGGGIPTSSSPSIATTIASPPPTMPMMSGGGTNSSSFFGQSNTFGGGGGFGASGASGTTTSAVTVGGVGFSGFGSASNSPPPPPAAASASSSSSSSMGFVGFGGSGGGGSSSGVQSSSSTGFGQPHWQQQQQPPPPPPPSSGFGSAPTAFTGFGTSSTAATTNTGFGSSSIATPATTTSTGFGGFKAGPSSSFSSSTTAPPSSLSTMVFGSSSTVAATTSSSFAPAMTSSTTTTGLATAGFAPASTTTTKPLNANASPFLGRSQDPSARMGFGGSGGGGFGSSTSTGFGTAGFGDGGGGFGTSTSSGTGSSEFGTGGTGFGASGGSRGFGGSGGFGGNSTATTFPPHGPSPPPPSATSDDVATPLSSSLIGRRIPRKNLRREDGINMTGDSTTTEGVAVATTPMASGGGGDGEEQLSALRAKIREKREKLQKLKMNEQTHTQEHSNSEGRKSLGATALSTTRDHDHRTQGDANADLAARNALRFSTASSDRDQSLSKLMPADLKDRGAVAGSSAWSTPAQSSGDDEDDNGINDENVDVDDDDDLDGRNLSNAKSLVGTCLSMCPDEELVRREKEGDIQLLEVTDPGGLHPKEWTLRDTAVKRFRRSAADFKLDIPELIRPPDVLERVCGYLEEWVMERDRQGPDKRWAQQPSDTPPPLDVYQFIWDRTRMVRKDFILQNYIGTGGKCDARAVRCHERIARWHAMSEHQLSHIPEFVAHQSQQNIAELGQTMKTLNNYYDDASGRSLAEIADNEGNVNGSISPDCAQGCVSDIVMGKAPIDFDGGSLQNSASSQDVATRIIGKNGIHSPTLGTAEPEMRGLYILLTLNNEGGMEVLKYSGRLCGQKPDVFYSKPVQLALSIFQAKKERNYARFFSLMRSPSTPYLFACIMYKYVESMRKEALIIMSRTYGAKHKTTGQPFYDSYPLVNLVKLLCYEDEEEARTACQHYGITVEGDQVLWRHGSFAEPRDPEKGNIIHLKPRKMMRTIETKLNGATRLSVCRGGVSGEGATLSITISRSHDTAAQFDRKKAQEAAEKARSEAMKLQLEIEGKARAERENIDIERRKQEKLAAENRARAEAAKRAELERLEQERLQRERKLAEQRQKELEARRLAEEKAAAERAEMEKQEKERQEREMARKRAEEEARERERQRQLAKQREEEARRLAEIQAAKERAEKEIREREERQRLAELKRKAEEEGIREAQEEKARRIEMMWIEKIEKTRKMLVWRLWRKQMQKHEGLQRSRLCLESLDPTATHFPSPITSEPPIPITQRSNITPAPEFDLESQIYRLATAPRQPINLARMFAECMLKCPIPDPTFHPAAETNSNVTLFKLAVILPKREHGIENLYDSMRMWVNSHLRTGFISTHTFTRRSMHFETRAVSVIGNEDSVGCSDCNAALILLPSDSESTSQIEYPDDVEKLLASNVPRIVLVLGDDKCMGTNSSTEIILEQLVGPPNDREGVVAPTISELDNAFEQCCEAVVVSQVKSLSDDYPSIVRVSLANVGFLCLQRLFRNMDAEGIFRSAYSIDSFFSFVKQTITMLATELSNASNEIHQTKQHWPPIEFYDEGTDSIPTFFNGQHDLPFDWHVPFSDLDLEAKLLDSFQELLVKESFVKVVERLGTVLSPSLEQQLLTMMDNDDIARCFVAVVSIIVNGELKAQTRDETIVFLPTDTLSSIIESVATYEAPCTPEPVLIDIPDYLFKTTPTSYPNDDDEANYSDDESVKSDDEGSNNEKENTVQAIERNDNKRKPQEMSERGTPKSERIKRIRSQEPLPMETAEQKRSKEFTSYLEALLSSGEG